MDLLSSESESFSDSDEHDEDGNVHDSFGACSSSQQVLSSNSSSSRKRLYNVDNERSKRQKLYMQNSDSDYASSGLKTSLHGTIYQLQLLMLFAHRARNNYHQFQLATEMDSAEKFDDVVIKYKNTDQDTWTWRFLQAKHKLNPEKSKITVRDLTTQKDDDFSLQKYFLSFCKIKENPKFENEVLGEFTLCTNTGLDFVEQNKRKKDGRLSQLARMHNEAVRIWKSYFSGENTIDKDKMLYVGGYTETIKDNFRISAKDDLGRIFKTIFSDKVDYEKLKEYGSIVDYLKLFKITTHSFEQIKKIKNTFGNKNNEIKKPELKTLTTTTTKQVLELGEILNKYFTNFKISILNKQDFEELKNVDSILQKTNAKNATFDEAQEAVKNELNKVVDKLEATLHEKLAEYSNKNSQKFFDLSENINKIRAVRENIKDFLNNMEKLSDNDMLRDNIENLNKHLNESTKNMIKKPNADLNETKSIIQDDLEKAITESVSLELLLDQNKFDKYMEEFIEKFQIVTNYPNVDTLNIYLRLMLGEDFSLLNSDLATDSFEKEMLDWLKQYNKGRSKFLSTENANVFFQEIKSKLHNIMATGLSKAYPEKLRTYRLRFNNNIDLFKDEQYLVLITNFTRLTAIKVLQTLKQRDEYKAHDSYLFVRIRTLLQQQETKTLLYESFNSQNSHHLLIIECQKKSKIEFNDPNLKALLRNFQFTLESNPKKKLVIISNDGRFYSDYTTNFKKCRMKEVKMSFKKLNKKSQERLLHKTCTFQGKKMELNKLINHKTAQQIFDEGTLTVLVEDKLIEIGDDDSFYFNDYIQEYYVERNLHRQTIKNDVIKTDKFIELFFITGISDIQLMNIGVVKNNIHKFHENSVYSTGIIWCDADQDPKQIFTHLCNAIPEHDVHWLEYQKDVFYWKKSKGNYNKLHEYVDNDQNIEYFFDEDFFSSPSNMDDKIVIIANESGVGKSTFLTSLARKMKTKLDTLWIFRVNLNDFAFNKEKLLEKDNRIRMKSLKDITFNENDIALAIDYFVEMVSEGNPRDTTFEKRFLKFILKVTKKDCVVPGVVILFDGFDEICPTYSTQTINLIKALSQSNVTQIYITTRLYEKNLLENKLQLPAFVLKHLEEQEQVQFLNQFWKFSLKFFKVEDNPQLRQKMLDYLEKIKKNVEIVSEAIEKISDYSTPANNGILRSYVDAINFETFAGQLLYTWKNKIIDNDTTFNVVPLHLRMLAEITFYKNFQFVENVHLIDLYNDFIEIKYNIFYDEKKNLGNTVASDEIRLRDTTSLRKMFHAISFEILFPDSKIEVLEEDIRETEKRPLARTGLLILRGNRINFIHRSFAAYFLSEYAVKKIHSCKIQALLLNSILLQYEYNFIREFLNSHIEREESFLNDIELSEAVVNDLKIIHGHDNVLHTVVHEGYIHTLKFLLNKTLKYPAILEKLLITAGKYGPILDEMIHHPIRRSKSDFRTIKVILDKLRGHHNILEKVVTKTTETNGLILVGTQTSFTIVEKTIACKKLNLLKIFLDEIKDNSEFLNVTLKTTKMGLLNFVAAVTFVSGELFSQMLNIFLETIEDVNILEELILSSNKDENTILHTLAYSTTKLLGPLLDWLIKIKMNHEIIVEKIVLAKNVQKLTALEIAVYKENCSSILDLLNFIQTHFTKTIFNDISSNNSEKNIIFKAIVQGKTESTKTLLGWFYEKVDNSVFSKMLLTTSSDKRSALHLVCARNFNETLGVFLEFLKNINNVNILNQIILSQEGAKTPLAEVLYWGNDITVEVFLKYLSSNIDKKVARELIFKTEKHGNTILHVTVERGTSTTLEKLLQFIIHSFGCETLKELILKNDAYGNSVLHTSVSRVLESNCDTNKVLLDFIHQNLGISVLKTIIFKANDYGTTPLKCVKTEFLDNLKEKIEVILKLIIDRQGSSIPAIDFTKQELDELKIYLENYSVREHKKEIMDIIERMILDSPESNIRDNINVGASSSTTVLYLP